MGAPCAPPAVAWCKASHSGAWLRASVGLGNASFPATLMVPHPAQHGTTVQHCVGMATWALGPGWLRDGSAHGGDFTISQQHRYLGAEHWEWELG